MKNIAHGRSTLGLSGDYLIPVDYHDRFFPFYWNKISGRGDEPILDVATIVPDKRFGKVVAVEEETTNLFRNPDFSDGTTGWQIYNSTTEVKDGYLEITRNRVYGGIWQGVSVKAGITYTMSYWYKHISGSSLMGGHIDGHSTMVTRLRIDKGPWVGGTVINCPDDNEWHLIEVQHTPTSDNSNARFYIQPGRGVTDDTVTVGHIRIGDGFGVQIEEKNWATSFTVGSRSRGSLTYQQSLFTPHEFTISTWFKVNTLKSRYQPIVEVCSSMHQHNRLLVMVENNALNNVSVRFGNSTVNEYFSSNFVPEIDKWHMLTLTYNGTTYILYADGKEVGRKNGPMVTPLPNATVNIGGRHWGILDGHLANFLISPRAAHPDEIEAWHEYGKAFYDPYSYYAVWG